jgi:hypothetical protein
MTIFLAFDCKISLEQLNQKLLALTPWQWRISDSDTYGEGLWVLPGPTAKINIAYDEGAWVIQARVRVPDETLSEPLLRADFENRILPALGAKNIREGWSIR